MRGGEHVSGPAAMNSGAGARGVSYHCRMLSLYEEFPDDPVTQRSAKEEEVEFHFIVSSVPEKRVVDDDCAKDKFELQFMLMPGVALRLLPDGDVTTGGINVCYPHLFHTRQGKTLWDPREIADLEPFKVYRARGSYFFSDIRKEPYVTIWEMLDPLPDPEMEELSTKTAEPVILETSIGQLVLDRTFSTFEGKADDLGVKVSMCYEGPELLLAGQGNMAKKFKSALNFINNVLSQEYLDSARMLGAEKALPAANRWRHDVAEAEGRPTPAPKLGVEDVYAKLTPTAVNIPHRGNIGVEFDDGYMFGGHPVTVKTKRDGTPTSIKMDV